MSDEVETYWRNRAHHAEDARATMIEEREDQARGTLVGMALAALSGAAVGIVLGMMV